MRRNTWLLMIALACALVGLSSVIEASMYDGEWHGTTDQGYNISFTVVDNKITSVSLKFSYCGYTEDTTASGGLPAITGDQFTLSYSVFNNNTYTYDQRIITGLFDNRIDCHGTWYAVVSPCGSINGTWTAERDVEGPLLDLSPSSFLEEGSFDMVASFASPGDYPNGLAFDGEYLWNVESDDGKIYKLDTSGNIITSFDSPGSWPNGVAFDGTYLWNSDSVEDVIYKLDTSGNTITFFDSPDTAPRGLAFDGTYLWNVDSNKDKIYKLGTTGLIISSFDSPGSDPQGLAFDGRYLWNVDYDKKKIYRLDTSGKIINTFTPPGPYPLGVAFDGTYLWTTDRHDKKIYKLRINIPSLKAGSSRSQTFTITNLGKENLAIGALTITGQNRSEFSVQNDNCSHQTIAPLGTGTFTVVFSPATGGEKTATLSINSNDPETPVVYVPMSGTCLQDEFPWELFYPAFTIKKPKGKL